MATTAHETLTDKLKPICEKHHVRVLRVFGSVARGTPRPDSDVDLLVDYEDGYVPNFFQMEQLEQDLSPMFNGRPVDVARPSDVHWFIRGSVMSSARTLYER